MPLSQGSMRPIAASGGMRPVVPGAAPTGAAMAIPGKGAPLPGAGGSSALAQPAAPPRKSSAIQIADPSTGEAIDLPYAKPKPPEASMALAPGEAPPQPAPPLKPAKPTPPPFKARRAHMVPPTPGYPPRLAAGPHEKGILQPVRD